MAFSLGRFAPSFLGGSIDTTVALANLNFDFTLYKVEAPKEYADIGKAISPLRKQEAEGGNSHRTARKLGALFQQLLPPTPKLHRTYGLRCSEIVKSSKHDPKSSEEYGFLADHVGVDATSLWASATSGKHSISVHLLACMLARFWDPSEATAIWVEIVSNRRDQICKDFEQNKIEEIPVLNAAIQQISRKELAEWDASARAWLQFADKVKAKQQTQLKLIINNVQLPVNNSGDLHSSVMKVWKGSLQQLEGLLDGMPLDVKEGGVLLALYAWHLYPDMVVLGSRQIIVEQNDGLLPRGALLTVGLQNPGSRENNGVYWSLPLAHLNYYGDPVVRRKSLSISEHGRLSMDELTQAATCAYLKEWDISDSDTLPAFQLSIAISEMLVSSAPKGVYLGWLDLLSKAARRQIALMDRDPKYAHSLRNLGRRRGEDFLGGPVDPFFGIVNYKTFAEVARSQEDVIEALRQFARKTGFHSEDLFIRYKKGEHNDERAWVYATALPQDLNGTKRTADSEEKPRAAHLRWISTDVPHQTTTPMQGSFVTQQTSSLKVDTHLNNFGSLSLVSFLKNKEQHSARQLEYCEDEVLLLEHQPTRFIREFEGEQEELIIRAGQVDKQYFRLLAGTASNTGLFARISGPPLFTPHPPNSLGPFGSANDMLFLFASTKVNDDLLVRAFLGHLLAVDSSGRHFNEKQEKVTDSMRGLAMASELYKTLPDATVDVRILKSNISEMHWAREVIEYELEADGEAPDMMLEDSIACVTAFETGRLNLRPDQLRNVMAMSCGDSLYVARSLTQDPISPSRPGSLRRVMGNIGRAGVAFLVPPHDPRVKRCNEEEWHLVSHYEFDGNCIDSFESTTLHLSFTEAEFPIDTGFSGGQDVEAFLLETLISVHDRGLWVADLDVLSALQDCSMVLENHVTWNKIKKGMIQERIFCSCGRVNTHIQGSNVTNAKGDDNVTERASSSQGFKSVLQKLKQHLKAKRSLKGEALPIWETSFTIPAISPAESDVQDNFAELTALDNWDEILLAPPNPTIVRAHGNWQARLAATAVCISRGRSTLVLTSNPCWECIIPTILLEPFASSNPTTMIM